MLIDWNLCNFHSFTPCQIAYTNPFDQQLVMTRQWLHVCVCVCLLPRVRIHKIHHMNVAQNLFIHLDFFEFYLFGHYYCSSAAATHDTRPMTHIHINSFAFAFCVFYISFGLAKFTQYLFSLCSICFVYMELHMVFASFFCCLFIWIEMIQSPLYSLWNEI